MAIIVNNPSGEGDSSVGLAIGLLILVVAAILFIVYGLPALRTSQTPAPAQPNTTNIQVDIPNPLPTDSTNN